MSLQSAHVSLRALASLPPPLGEVLRDEFDELGLEGWQRGRRLRLWLWRGRFLRLFHLVCYCCLFCCFVTCFLVFLLWCIHTDASYFLDGVREFYW